MSLTIPVAHDFICPWCWVGLLQATRLEKEFDVKFEWRGYELLPIELEWPDHVPGPPPPSNKPPVLSRFEFLTIADGVEMPKAERPRKMRTFNAHEAVEYAKTEGVANGVVEALYRAYWEQGKEINNVDVIVEVTDGLIKDKDAMVQAIETKQFKDKIIGFDDDAYASGVYNVPTFYILGERYAEQPYVVLSKAVAAAQEETVLAAS